MSLWFRIVTALKRRVRRPTRYEVGMTLIEIMVVVAIIGLLMGTVGVVAYRRYQKARVTNAKQVIDNIRQALQHYRMETNEECPADLKELFDKKFLTKEPKDPWGEQLSFKCPGEHDTDLADIYSKGPDKKEGTEDDVKSWEE